MSASGGVLDRHSFATHFQRAHSLLWCVAAGVLQRRDGADDVLQDAALIGLEKLQDLRDVSGFDPWMGRIVKLVALNHRRKGQGRQRVLRLGSGDPEGEDWQIATPEARGHAARAQKLFRTDGTLRPEQELFDDQVADALSDLSDDARLCLILKTVMQLDYREISRVMGMAEGTAMSHVHRARSKMRTALTTDKGVRHESP